jgi:hypothetical protein
VEKPEDNTTGKLDNLETVGARYDQATANHSRKQIILNFSDRDRVSGVDQFRLRTSPRGLANVGTADPEQDVPTPLELLMARKWWMLLSKNTNRDTHE